MILYLILIHSLDLKDFVGEFSFLIVIILTIIKGIYFYYLIVVFIFKVQMLFFTIIILYHLAIFSILFSKIFVNFMPLAF